MTTLGLSTTGLAQSAAGPAPASPPVQRLTDEALRDQFTARDLLGREVVGRNGEAIGEITDVELGAGFPPPLVLGLGPSDSDRMQPTRTRGGQPSDPVTSTPTNSPSGPDRANEPAVIVSVGGVLGFGGHLVRVPASRLRFDPERERVVLDVSPEQVRALTEAGAAEEGRAAPVGTPGAGVALTGDNLDQDRQLLLDAIARTPELQEVADRINPLVNDRDIVVFGTVHSAAQRRALIDLVERHTDKPVHDRLLVDPSVKGESTRPQDAAE